MYTITDDHLLHVETLIDECYQEWDEYIEGRDEFENGTPEWHESNTYANFLLGKAHGLTEVLDYFHDAYYSQISQSKV